MELKRYQRAVIEDLTRFLALLNETGSIPKAYKTLWTEKNVNVGMGGMASYKNEIPGVPNVCLKVPTGGGKTLIACHSIKPIFESLPPTKAKAVVWLVPSDAILEQTIKALTDAHHPYRQRINADFGGRVEVYTKQQLLNGQNFNPAVILGQLSVFVLSYDSFRTSKKEGRKAYQENGNLASFAKYFNDPEIALADTDETALIQVVRNLKPVVVVDESHHATSDLSVQMLKDFYPSFILDLTATPKTDSNIISYVDALQLKKENMVKLPVIVYNRHSQTEVFTDAISIRNKLENQAVAERQKTGRYIRPIVLFQAQPKNNEDSTTFEHIRQTLLEIGIPENQIAIKTADKNDLRGVDLLSENCPIRFIITVNALKEGWDCPFAYILATVAHRSSIVDVEQILGRILRQPYTKKNDSNVLNISYVITSSNHFQETLDKVIKGLNNAGFSAKDYRARQSDDEPAAAASSAATNNQKTIDDDDSDDFPEIDVSAVRDRTVLQNNDDATGNVEDDPLFTDAVKQAETYEAGFSANDTDYDTAPQEVREYMNVFYMNDVFADEAANLRLPQFVITAPPSIFSSSETKPLTPEALSKGFTLRDKDTIFDFSAVQAEIAQVDIEESKDAVPRAWKIDDADYQLYMKWLNAQPPKRRLDHCKSLIVGQLSKINTIDDRELKEYVGRIIDGLSPEQLEDLQHDNYPYFVKIKAKIGALLAAHAEKNFKLWLEQGHISCQPEYRLREYITPVKSSAAYPKSLYTAEEEMNGLEKTVVWELSNLSNIKWWHRNISRTGFCINGFINSYPDIIAMTKSGKIIVIEPKGDFLENQATRNKAAIGRDWEKKAGDRYRFYMVFPQKDLQIEGAVQLDRFLEIVKGL
jgi:type III restriction enzyme